MSASGRSSDLLKLQAATLRTQRYSASRKHVYACCVETCRSGKPATMTRFGPRCADHQPSEVAL